VPHIFIRKSHQWPRKIFISGGQRLFQQHRPTTAFAAMRQDVGYRRSTGPQLPRIGGASPSSIAIRRVSRAGFSAACTCPTGFTNLEPTIYSKWIQALKQIAPHVMRVAIMFNPETAPYLLAPAVSAQADAQKMGIEAIVTPIRETAEIEAAMARLSGDPGGGIIVPPDAFMAARHKMIVDLAARYKLPAIQQYRHFAVEGRAVQRSL
jgi:ABC-type uncharacterized transport system substrate-binding protein